MDDHNTLRTRIEEDGLTVWLIMPDGFDRAMLSPGMCDAVLQGSGIDITSDTKDRIEQFIGQATTAKPGAFQAVIATGTPAQHGQDGRIEWLLDAIDAEEQDTNAPKDNEKDPVSFYDRSVYTVVTIGDRLAKIYQPTTGIDGRTVTGKNLAASDGKPLEFKHDESIIVAQGDQVLAQCSGVLDRSGQTICIRDTLEVDQYVDFNTGNIAFNRNVLVHKGVRDRFKINADGDIEVRGLIEAATITAGGDLRALGGFAGREQGVAKVAGDLYAKYLDAVKINVRGDLCVDREIINCQSVVLGHIKCPQGAIIGGETRVAGSIAIGELGADGLPLTPIYVGAVPHLDPLIHELSGLITGLINQRQKLIDEQELIETTSGGRVMASHKERLCELMYEIADVQTQLDRAEPSLEKVNQRAEAMRKVQVQVEKRVFANTVLIGGGLRYRIKSELQGPLRITMDPKGQLQIDRSGAGPTMLARSADLSEAA